MTHPRARIRDAITQRLSAKAADGSFPTKAEDRVFKSRLVPIDTNDDKELPAILIYARDDSRDPNKDYGPDAEDSFVDSHLTVVVEAIVRGVAAAAPGGPTVDDRLDTMAEQIEAALDDWEIPGFEGATMRLGDTDIDVIADAGRKPIGAIGLVWHVCYSRPWRVRAPGTRPHTVNTVVPGGSPERIITSGRGPYNEPRAPSADRLDDFVAGFPVFPTRGRS